MSGAAITGNSFDLYIPITYFYIAVSLQSNVFSNIVYAESTIN